jgi:hypothetical protein
MDPHGPWGGSDVLWVEVVYWGEVVDYTILYIVMYVSVTNNNQPPRVGCLLAEKRVVALEVSIGGGGGSMPGPKIQ